MAFELFELTGKRALVTGSSQGIGFALAQGLAEHGAEIVLNGRDAAKLEAAAARLMARATHVVGFSLLLPVVLAGTTARTRRRRCPGRSWC